MTYDAIRHTAHGALHRMGMGRYVIAAGDASRSSLGRNRTRPLTTVQTCRFGHTNVRLSSLDATNATGTLYTIPLPRCMCL
eukprot:scaffold7542_cov124-Isochrysis_galbana.AAC.9